MSEGTRSELPGRYIAPQAGEPAALLLRLPLAECADKWLGAQQEVVLEPLKRLTCVSAVKAPRTLTLGPTLGARLWKAGCCTACTFRAKSFLELVVRNLCKTSCIMGLQSQSLAFTACPEDHITACSFFFFFPVQRGSQDWNQLLFLELLLKKQQQFFSVQRCFCEKEFLLGARCGVGL